MQKTANFKPRPIFFQIIGQLQGVEGFADVETHNLREYKNS